MPETASRKSLQKLDKCGKEGQEPKTKRARGRKVQAKLESHVGVE
jgi:hypothetical protein